MPDKFLWNIFSQNQAPVKDDLINNLLSTKKAIDAY